MKPKVTILMRYGLNQLQFMKQMSLAIRNSKLVLFATFLFSHRICRKIPVLEKKMQKKKWAVLGKGQFWSRKLWMTRKKSGLGLTNELKFFTLDWWFTFDSKTQSTHAGLSIVHSTCSTKIGLSKASEFCSLSKIYGAHHN